ncbi:MAG TPA: glycosyltransferase family 9 protein [Syntrophales bacterium]|nr:glycosyltransferase family 9 protein [Syntrophales bacterium]
MRRALVVQLGDIGDVVWSLPTLVAVKKAHPEAEVSLLVREMVGDLLAAEDYLHRIWYVPEKKETDGWAYLLRQIKLLRDLRKEKFDLVVDLRTGDRGAVLTRMTGAPIRAGIVCEGASWLRNAMFNHLVKPVELKPRPLGAAEQSLRIVRALGIPSVAHVPTLHVSESGAREAKTLLARLRGEEGRPFVSVNIFSRWAYKEWPLEKWGVLMKRIREEMGYHVLLVGAPNERARAEIFSGWEGVFSAIGETTLGTLAAVLKLSSLHVGVDSAAPIIAAAVGTPTVTIYGPSDWRDWAPVGESHRVVCAPMDCVPCHRKGCHDRGQSPCLEAVSPDDVMKAIQELVSPLPRA